MKREFVWVAVILVLLSSRVLPARAKTAEQAFAKGKTLLAEADFPGALQAFAVAARADRDNQEYLQHYVMVRQVIVLRQRLGTEKDDSRWEYMARGLHAFYVSRGLYGEALELDRKMHARLSTASTATLLAETQLALDMNAQAAETLAGLPQTKQTTGTQALHGLALARQKKQEEARKVAATIRLASDAGPGVVYCVARLSAAVGDDDEALALLTRCFESVAPSRLDGVKEHAKRSPEFARLVSTSAFADVLETESKVPESKCSGGSGCAGCPMRGKCSGSQGQ